MSRPTSHIHLQPVLNLRLTKEIGEEVSIGEVLLVSASKLPRIRNRIGYPWRLSEAPRFMKEAVAGHETFAIARIVGAGELARRQAEAQIREACALLRCVSWPFAKRSRRNLLRAFGPADVAYRILSKHVIVNTQNGKLTGTGMEQRRALVPFELDGFWKEFQKSQRWLQMLKRNLHGRPGLDAVWQGAVRRAAVLFGESLNEADRSRAFLFDMMALDTVLLGRNDRSRKMFPRLDSALGWSNAGLTSPWFQGSDLKRLSDRRNELVHDGNSGRLKARDLILADDLLGNLLSCVCRMGNRWERRDDMIQFAERISCRKRLGLRPYSHEGKLPFRIMRPRHTKSEISKL